MSNKKTSRRKNEFQKTTCKATANSDSKHIIWVFDKCDKSGDFAFDINKIEANGHLHEIMEKMIAYESMTWAEIKLQTHDQGKSKHHIIDTDGMSAEAIERIEAMKLQEDSDSIFSFALQNRLRIIGTRENELFHVIWYDPEHKFYPSKKK